MKATCVTCTPGYTNLGRFSLYVLPLLCPFFKKCESQSSVFQSQGYVLLELKEYYHLLYPLRTLIITFEKDTEVDKIQLQFLLEGLRFPTWYVPEFEHDRQSREQFHQDIIINYISSCDILSFKKDTVLMQSDIFSNYAAW